MPKIILFLLGLHAIICSQSQLPLAIQTPPFGTSHLEMISFLNKIDDNSSMIEMEIGSKSNRGREIPVIFIPERRNWKPQQISVMIFAQQHGDEPSGKEALLMLIHHIYLNGVANFPNLNLILIPMVNPDGNELDQRRNSRQIDLNRNHLILTEPETRLLHQLFAKYKPQVTLDVYEYGGTTWLRKGYIKDFGEQLDCISNPALPAELKEYALNTILNPVIEMTRVRNVTANRYLITSEDFNRPARHSTTDIDDGRKMILILLSASLVISIKTKSLIMINSNLCIREKKT